MTEKDKTDLALNVLNEYTRAVEKGVYLDYRMAEAATSVILKALQSGT